MIIDVLFIWVVCYAVAKAANALEARNKPTPEQERQRFLDELYGRW
tara:strand:- start:52 stop:189 length:138 start_codon:yes stop_codon:yes gene_type:complete